MKGLRIQREGLDYDVPVCQGRMTGMTPQTTFLFSSIPGVIINVGALAITIISSLGFGLRCESIGK